MKRWPFLALLLVCLFYFARPSIAYAATSTSSPLYGLTVAPAIEQIKLSKDQTSTSFNAHVTNDTNEPMSISLSALDFTYLNLGGSLSFIAGQNHPHGLAGSLVLQPAQFSLAPHQSQAVTVTIQNADKLAAGGHYGAIVYKDYGPQASDNNGITVNQSVTTLIFVTTAGQGTESISLATPVIGPLQTSLPNVLDLVMTDTGNTQTTVRGYAQLIGPGNHLVAQGIINGGSGLILPESSRLFPVQLTTQNNASFWPALYHIRVYYRHDGQNSFTTEDETFWYVNGLFILGSAAVIIALAATCMVALAKLRKPHIKRR